MTTPFFPDEEYETRLWNVRQKMAERDLDACLISSPENIYYLSGLDHWGFFAYHGLIVPREGEMCLITRNMERVTIENQVTRARFVGHADSDDPAQVTCKVLAEAGLNTARLGMEKGTLFLPPRIAEGIIAGTPKAQWSDISNLVDELRLVKSPHEQEYTRQAAAVTDAILARPGCGGSRGRLLEARPADGVDPFDPRAPGGFRPPEPESGE
jgi:Xaa-Pro dipeptidase